MPPVWGYNDTNIRKTKKCQVEIEVVRPEEDPKQDEQQDIVPVPEYRDMRIAPCRLAQALGGVLDFVVEDAVPGAVDIETCSWQLACLVG
jgi:hypothetical protein